MPIPSRPVTVDDLVGKSCWICAETEDDSTAPTGPGSRFVHPCKCTLVAHESCLLSWIYSQQSRTTGGGFWVWGAAGGGRAGGQDLQVTVRCPQCQMPYQMTDSCSPSERRLHDVFSWVARTITSSRRLVVGASVGVSAYVLLTSYGRFAVRMLIGRDLATRVFNRPLYLHPNADLPLIPFVLVAMRLPVLLRPSYWLLPTLLMLPYVQSPHSPPGSSRFGVDGFTRRLLRGNISSYSASSGGRLWPLTPVATLLLIPWVRAAYFPLRRALYRVLFRSWYREEAARRAEALALPRPQPSSARHMMDRLQADHTLGEGRLPDGILNEGQVHEVLRISDADELSVFISSHERVQKLYALSLDQPPALGMNDSPRLPSAEHGREPYTDAGILTEDVEYKGWERRTIRYRVPATLNPEARQALQALSTMPSSGDEAVQAERLIALNLLSTWTRTMSSSYRVLNVEYLHMDEVHRVYMTPSSVLGLIVGGLSLPVFAAAGGSLLLYLSNFIPPLRRLLGLSPRPLALGSVALGSSALASGISTPTPSDGISWSFWDTGTGDDPVWWRNALGALLWVAARDVAVATLRLLRYRARRKRHLKSFPFAPSQLETLTVRSDLQTSTDPDSSTPVP